jgi:Zn-finger domain-containing protein|tara:strand:+ start:2576 stop:2803 length:228 start_codon:yes stop_codon:yes gene_type:complete
MLRTKTDIKRETKELLEQIERDTAHDRKVLDTLFISLKDVELEDVLGAIKTTLSVNMDTLKELEEEFEQLKKESK